MRIIGFERERASEKVGGGGGGDRVNPNGEWEAANSKIGLNFYKFIILIWTI